jgi:hypothetical protein
VAETGLELLASEFLARSFFYELYSFLFKRETYLIGSQIFISKNKSDKPGAEWPKITYKHMALMQQFRKCTHGCQQEPSPLVTRNREVGLVPWSQ